MPMRRGFTLIELLVASVIFIIGFVGVFTLFLSGVRFRKLSEDLTRCALASSSLITEIRIDAGREGGPGPKAPSEYVGDGLAASLTVDDQDADRLFAYPQQPGLWYRVMTCTDLGGQDDPGTTGLKLRLVVLSFPTADTTLTFSELQRRLRLKKSDGTDPLPAEIPNELTRRGIALASDAVIVRRPAWMP